MNLLRTALLSSIFSFCKLYNNQLSCDIFFFIVTATSVIYTLSLHDALPIFIKDLKIPTFTSYQIKNEKNRLVIGPVIGVDRKSTRLNSSHVAISYAVFCLKKKKKEYQWRVEQMISYNV